MASVGQVGRVTMLTSDGRRTELTRTGSTWEARTSEQDGTEQDLPWFRGALEVEEKDRIYWDGPATDGVNEDAGLTASIAWTRAGETAKPNVAAFHIGPKLDRLGLDRRGTPRRPAGGATAAHLYPSRGVGGGRRLHRLSRPTIRGRASTDSRAS